MHDLGSRKGRHRRPLDEGWSSTAEHLRQNGYRMEVVDLLEEPVVPRRCEALVVADPRHRSAVRGGEVMRTRVVVFAGSDLASNAFLADGSNSRLLVQALDWVTLGENLVPVAAPAPPARARHGRGSHPVRAAAGRRHRPGPAGADQCARLGRAAAALSHRRLLLCHPDQALGRLSYEKRRRKEVDMHQQLVTSRAPTAAVACGALGVAASVMMYWLVLPGVVLGLAAVALGWRARRADHRELGSVAMTLGVVAVLLVPAIISIADSAEEWGRDCALHPTSDPHC